MVEEFAVLCGPSYLHDSGGVEGDLIIPLPRVACAEGGTNTLEGGGVAPAQKPGLLTKTLLLTLFSTTIVS